MIVASFQKKKTKKRTEHDMDKIKKILFIQQ